MATKAPFDPITKRVNHIPDTRMSWLVMFASFGSMFIVIGYQRSFGLLFVAYSEKYGYSSGRLSIVNATQSFAASMCGMVVMNFVLKKISVRMSCMIGATIQATGTILCYWLKSIDALIVCHGFLFGFGHSLLYCPSIVIVSHYFETHRSIAMAISQCGSSFGGIAFPYITRLLIDTFGLEGALLVLGALLFNQLIFYAWFRPIIRLDIDSKNTKKNDAISKQENGEVQSNGENLPDSDTQEIVLKDENTNKDKDSIGLSKSMDKIQLESNLSINADNKRSELSLNGRLSPYSSNSNPRLYSSQSQTSLTHRKRSSQTLSFKEHEILTLVGDGKLGLSSSVHDLMVLQNISDRVSIKGDEDIDNKQYKEKSSQDATLPNGADPVDVALLEKDCTDDSKDKKKSWVPNVLKMPAFWIIAVFAAGGVVSAGCPALFIPPLAREKGLSNSDAAFFLTISAATDFVGRLLSGLILHFKFTDSATLVLIPLSVNTLFFCLTPLLNGFYPLMMLTLMYGLCSSMFWTLWSLVIIDVLGLANLGPALGFLFVIGGFAISASFPLAGLLRDVTATYSSSFFYFGSASCMSMVALIVLLFPKYKARCCTCKST